MTGVLPSTGRLLFEKLEHASSNFDWGSRESLERPLLLLATACQDLAPSVANDGLLFAHRLEIHSQVYSEMPNYEGLVARHELEDEYRSLLSAFVAFRFISLDSFNDLQKMGRYVTAGNVRRLAGHCRWMLQAAAAIEDVRGESSNAEFRRWLLHMGQRLEYGASDDSVELCRIGRFGDVRGLGRIRASQLTSQGYNDLTKLLQADIRELVRCVNSRERATALREAVIRYLNDRTRHNQVLHSNRASACGRDPRVVNDFYSSRGIEFNRAALVLLQSEFSDAREQDVGGEPEPDLAIPLPDGLLVIECKAKESTEGTIGLHEAFEVIAKSSHLETVGKVTLGKPGFHSIPVRRATREGICLVTHVTFCEAIVRLWEGRLTRIQLIDLFCRPGLLDKRDLDAVVSGGATSAGGE